MTLKKIELYLGYLKDFIIMFLIYILSFFLKSKYNDVWVISERGYDAHDNGLALYEYIKKNNLIVTVKYIVDKNSKDAKKIRNEDIIPYKSFRHYFYFILANVLISTHIYGFSPNAELSIFLERKHIKLYKGKKVFLQHGISKDDILGLHYPNIKLDLFCCGALKEYNFIKDNFNFPEGIVQYTGLARYDNLARNIDNEDFILIMPTWRKWLNDIGVEEFKKSDFYVKYHHLLERIDKKQKIIFCLHPEFIKFRSTFLDLENSYIKIADYSEFSIPYLLKKCKYLITDYSSVFFDVAYMKKNIIFYQFDNIKFQLEHYNKGYLNYNDFGYVCGTEVEILEKIQYCESNQYNKNFDFLKSNYFTYEFGNCKRIINMIFKILGEEENAVEEKYNI